MLTFQKLYISKHFLCYNFDLLSGFAISVEEKHGFMYVRCVWQAFHSPPTWCTIILQIVIFLCIPDLSIKISRVLINWRYFQSKSQWLILCKFLKCFVNTNISWCSKDINRYLGLRITATESPFLDSVRYFRHLYFFCFELRKIYS